MKVSFKGKTKNLLEDEKVIGLDDCHEIKQQLIPSGSATKPKKTLRTKQLKEKFKSLSYIPKDELTSWSKLKRATVVGLGGSYTSLSNTLPTDSSKLFKTLSKSSMPINLNTVPKKLNDSDFFKSLHRSQPKTSSCSPVNEIDVIIYDQKISVSDSELKHDILNTNESHRPTVKIKSKSKFFKKRKTKKYRMVDDLSPEYSGLPFVKKLKILYERQKLAELESAIQTTRSLSLDYTDSNACSNMNMIEVLTRSQSEASCMLNSRINESGTIIPAIPHNFNMHFDNMNKKSQLSPDSNKTLKRKKLKSILKKLSDDRLSQNVPELKIGDRKHMDRLTRAQTLEGYVERRTKFTKSVTFNRTFSSPPSSTLPEEPDESLKHSPVKISSLYSPVFFPLPQHSPLKFSQSQLPSVTSQTSSLYNIANELDGFENSFNVDDQRPIKTHTNKICLAEPSMTMTDEEPPKLLTKTIFDKDISNSDKNSSETMALLDSDKCGEIKLVKGI